MENTNNNVIVSEADKVAVKKRAVTLNVEQIKELGENKELRDEVVRQIEESGLKGSMALAIAKAVLKRIKLKV